MSITWGNFESREAFTGGRKSGNEAPEKPELGEQVGLACSPVLSQNPLVPTSPNLPAVGERTTQPLPDSSRGFWDYVYWAGWAFVGFLGLVLAASVAKAIRYGVITDIINWMFGR